MKRVFLSLLFLSVLFMAYSQQKINLTANGRTVVVTLADNKATAELLEILPVTIEMSPYGGFEVVGPLPQSLPTSNSQIKTVPGDIMLYQANQLVIFYGSNSWSYTPIGHIDGATAQNVKELLGDGNVTVTLSAQPSGVVEINREDINEETIYDLSGNKVEKAGLHAGIYIVNGQKTMIK